jgi:hypothetical protein
MIDCVKTIVKETSMFWCKEGFNILWGTKIRVTKQIKESWTPFSMGHYVVHRANLTIHPYLILLSLQGLSYSWPTFMVISIVHRKGIWSFKGWFRLWKLMETKSWRMSRPCGCPCYSCWRGLWLNIVHCL